MKKILLIVCLALPPLFAMAQNEAQKVPETPTMTEAPKGEHPAVEPHEKGMLDMDWGLQIWTLLTFLVMMAILGKLALKPIAAALDKRGEAIQASLAEAEKARTEVKKMSDEAKKATDAARLEANRILDETRQAAENVRKEIMAKANTEAAELVKRASEGIEQQKQKALGELRQTVAELSVQVSEAVISRKLDDAMHKQLADQFIANLGKK